MKVSYSWLNVCLVLAAGIGCSTPTTSPSRPRHGAVVPLETTTPVSALASPTYDALQEPVGTPTNSSRDRTIEAGDIVVIEVFDEKELSVERRVQASGIIVYPLLGVVPVAGRSTTEVARNIADRLLENKFLRDPQVSVDVKEYRAQTVSVMGFVEKAGSIKLPSEQKMDILEAIAEAGGFSRTANKGRIDLTRDGKTSTYSFEDLRRVADPKKKIWLKPGDVIYVHESFI